MYTSDFVSKCHYMSYIVIYIPIETVGDARVHAFSVVAAYVCTCSTTLHSTESNGRRTMDD